MTKKITPEQQRWLQHIQSSETLRKKLRRLNLMIPIDTIAFILCTASLIIEGYDSMLCALAALFGVQLLFLVTIRRDTKRELKIAEEFEADNAI